VPSKFAQDINQFALTHAKVVFVDEPVLSDQTIIVSDGVISAIDISSSIDTAEMVVVDCTGLWITPGLADMHVHVWDRSEAAQFLANGVTTIRNMWGAPLHLSWRHEASTGELASPRLVTTSPVVDGVDENGQPIWKGCPTAVTPEQACTLVEEWAVAGYEQLKVYSLLTPEIHKILCREASKAGLLVTGHCPDAMTYEEAITNGQRCFEHLTMISQGHLIGSKPLPDWSERALFFGALSDRLDNRAIGVLATQMARDGVWNCPTLTVWQGSDDAATRPDEASARSEMAYMPRATVDEWASSSEQVSQAAASAHQRWTERRIHMVGQLHREGAPLLIGTDSLNPFVVHGFAIHDELQNFLRSGISTRDTVRAATMAPAEFLGEQGIWGEVKIGQRADMLLVTGNPLDDITVLRKPEHVIAAGRHFTRGALDKMLKVRSHACKESVSTQP
jgi:imidazolonepropionase-like amidohydrolase